MAHSAFVVTKRVALRAARAVAALTPDAPLDGVNLALRRFGRWTVLYRGPQDASGRNARWFCRCDCGRESLVLATKLRVGLSRACLSCSSKDRWARGGGSARAEAKA